MTVNVWPAMLMVPVRAAPGFAATLNATAPLPVPLAPARTVTQATLLLAVQVQPLVDFSSVEAVVVLISDKPRPQMP